MSRITRQSTRRDMSHRHRIAPAVVKDIEQIVRWYLRTAYGKWEGPGVRPFYMDPARVGSFAVDPTGIAAREPEMMFRLLVTMASYQSRRDVDIMMIQRSMSARRALAMTSPSRLRALVERSPCALLRDADRFDRRCDVRRDLERGITTCASRPRTPCHVKDATEAIGRMGDMGKMPTSAWLHLGGQGVHRWFVESCLMEDDPGARARRLVERFATLYRVGVKLASMFVTALSVPELGGVPAWWPDVDGRRIMVIDTNVSNAISLWRRNRGTGTYAARARWLTAAADQIDLSAMRSDLPRRSPRLVQQAIYLFRSRSNRVELGDACATSSCGTCPSLVCPFRDEMT